MTILGTRTVPTLNHAHEKVNLNQHSEYNHNVKSIRNIAKEFASTSYKVGSKQLYSSIGARLIFVGHNSIHFELVFSQLLSG